ncbi:MAG: hypothetical protein Q7T27_06530 [Pseudomonas sp.]|uniref:hypothetical protein n=1 Tax=Pseudomonas sp. TaxID=306 RepID=UPI002727A618|nr:hypothetical protein [Pseudomonas sp.]MDO8403135.1 hypothetical protein [Pseudomonas sp.]
MQTASTTIRIDRDVHARLAALAQATGRPLNDTVGAAVLALERALFVERVAAELESLRTDPAAWAQYVAEGDAAVADGVA